MWLLQGPIYTARALLEKMSHRGTTGLSLSPAQALIHMCALSRKGYLSQELRKGCSPDLGMSWMDYKAQTYVSTQRLSGAERTTPP